MSKKEYALEVGARTITAEFNDWAEQANGSVLVRVGKTAILATAVKGAQRENDFFPLTVEYEERFYAAGRILGSRFTRREGRPATEAILVGRVVDRTIRPLFNQKMRNEIQVVLTTLALEDLKGKGDVQMASIIAASLALGVSDIPWDGPVSATHLSAPADLLVCGREGAINMIEAGAAEVGEQQMGTALADALHDIEKIQAWQKAIIAEIGRPKSEIAVPDISPRLRRFFEKKIAPQLPSLVFESKIETANREWLQIFKKKFPEEKSSAAQELFDEAVNEIIHREAIDHGRRSDGRALDEIRPLFAQAGGVSPALHGSGLFYRGSTHILSVLTLGSPNDALESEGDEAGEGKRFIHHYNFPPFSTGETGKIGGTNRRMIGHGALAEKALAPVIPDTRTFPYTIRLVSEALSSNGSTSMGSVCGSTLALMDGGVPIKAPVAGIAMGLMMKDASTYALLTDIQGPEDHHGDMDFKVTGTRAGITAIQLDVKVSGVPLKILTEALEKSRAARLKILDVIEKEIPKPRPQLAPTAPRIVSLKIHRDQIGLIIGGGGKTINEIRETSGVDDISIENDGEVLIIGKGTTTEKARKIIVQMTEEKKAGK